MTRLLVTRPEQDSKGLCDALAAMHIDSIIAPMLCIKNIAGPAIATGDLQGFLVTSANGVRALAARTDNRDLPVYAVGDATARAALESGFGTVTSAAGDVADLADLVAHACDPADGAFFHAAGTVITGDLAGRLSKAGFAVMREKIYLAETVDRLPENAVRALTAKSVQGVVIFSPRTAETFVECLKIADLTMRLAEIRLIALSENVRVAAGTGWDGAIVAEKPTQESLLNAIRTWYY